MHIDNFFIVSSNLILLRLKEKNFEISEIFIKFYENICQPLYENNKYATLIQFIYNPKEYKKIKDKYQINSSNIEGILYGYRYCLNEFLVEEKDDENDNDYIYFSLYDKAKIKYLSEKYYPGSDIREEPYFELYSEIQKHFIEKPSEGCYVCLCKKGFYHSIPSGKLEVQDLNIKCNYCGKMSGENLNGIKIEGEIKIEPNYVILFKDESEIKRLKEDENKKEKLESINYMTLKKFKEKYITKVI